MRLTLTRAFRPTALALLAAGLLLGLADPASAQAPPAAVKWPGGDAAPSGMPGQYIAGPGAVIRWTVIITNTQPLPLMAEYLDIMDPAGMAVCDPSLTPCPSVNELTLLCTGADAPNPAIGPGDTCDPGTGTLRYANIPVPPLGTACVHFSTRVSNTAAGPVGNQGCLLTGGALIAATSAPDVIPTAPPGDACPAAPAASPVPTCSNVVITGAPPVTITVVKGATPTDENMDGDLDLTETIVWSVRISQDDTMPQTTFVFDDMQPGSTFVAFEPGGDLGGACTFNAGLNRIECPNVSIPANNVPITMTFRTSIACSAATDDDSRTICNQARVCSDMAGMNCVPSDDDGMAPVLATCLPFRYTNMTASTKAWSFEDVDMDGAIGTGDRATFVITARNDGRLDATNVVVTDQLSPACMVLPPLDPGTGTYDGPTQTLTYSLGTIAGMGGTATGRFTVQLIDPSPGTCCNQAFVTSAERESCMLPPIPTDDPVTPAVDDPTCLPFGPQPLVTVSKDFALLTDVNGNGVADPGDLVRFTITVQNVGGAPATNVDLSDTLLLCFRNFDPMAVVITPAGGGTNASQPPNPPLDAGQVIVTDIQGGGAPGELVAGNPVVITFDVEAAAANCCNQATLTYDQAPLPVMSNDPTTPAGGDQTCLQRAGTQLVLTKTAVDQDADGCYEPGETIAYSLRVQVIGGAATGLVLVDTIFAPPGVLTVTNPGSGTHDPMNNTITWMIGDQPAGYDQTFLWEGRLACTADGAAISDRANLTSTTGISAQDGWAGTGEGADVTVTKTAAFTDGNGNLVLDPGEAVTFTITVTNVGTCAAENVVVTDQLDADVDWTTLVVSNGGLNDGVGGLTWNSTTTPALASVAPTGSVVLTVNGTALDPATNTQPGFDANVDNTANAVVTGTFACPTAPVGGSSATLPIAATPSVLAVVKTAADQDADGCNEPGETITYSLTVTLTGGPATGIVLTDVITDPMAVLTAINPGTGTLAGNTITWNLGNQADGYTATETWTAVIDCAAADGTAFSDDASVTGGGATTGTDTLSSQVNAAVLAVTKNAAFQDANMDGLLQPGEVVDFTIVVTNTGSCAALAVVVNDQVDSDLDWAGLTVSDNGTNDGTGGLQWTGATTPALASVAPAGGVTLTVSGPALDPAANPQPTPDGTVDNSATATALGSPDPTLCDPIVYPPASDTGTLPLGEIFNIAPAPVTIDLLRNADMTDRVPPLAAFDAGRTPNATTCGVTSLDRVLDVAQAGVTLPGTFTLVGDATFVGTGNRGVIIYYEFTEYCTVGETPPGPLLDIRVRKSMADIIVQGF